ncbi:phage scaffolding protein [Macrococcus brunensis]|uniref:phage scaffolding protein n=1 Tax=Macrococcus brunensis TaxID=198483 RepID=UPI001EEFD476|nr:phage scaffolding protein [Macrococcus brunensis]ULG73213.1 phage scaffolding protein [Macrococcus brunensis]
MNREFLRGLGVTEDIIPQIINQHHDALRPLKEKADKADEYKQQAESAAEELKNRDEQITSLQAKAGSNEELNAELEKYKQINAQRDKEMRELQLDNLLKVEAMKQGAIDADDFLKVIDKSAITAKEDGTFEGIAELVSSTKEVKPHFFATEQRRAGNPPVKGAPAEVMTKQQIMAIQDTAQRQKAIRENSHLFHN